MAVTNVAELNALVERVKKAQREYASFTQEQVDKIFRAAALAAADARIPLAKMAVAESGMGIVEDKVIKNHFASFASSLAVAMVSAETKPVKAIDTTWHLGSRKGFPKALSCSNLSILI